MHFSVWTSTVFAELETGHPEVASLVAYLMTVARRGISSVHLAKELGVTQKTAWFLARRILVAMASQDDLLGAPSRCTRRNFGDKETEQARRQAGTAGPGATGKQAVVGIKERGGKVRAFPVESTDRSHLHVAIVEDVWRRANVHTYCNPAYRGLPGFEHGSVKHSAREHASHTLAKLNQEGRTI